MLGFIPMNDYAIVHRQSTELDEWGRPSWRPIYKGKCFTQCNTDLKTISELDGYQTTLDLNVYFKGLVEVTNGDKIEYTTANKVHKVSIIKDVSHFMDYAGKIVATRVVCGSAKRN